MHWTLYLVLSFCCLVICDESVDCGCGGSDTEEPCTCDQNESAYKDTIYLVVIALILAVGVVSVIVCCCLYNKKLKSMRKKTKLDKFVAAEQYTKQPLPDMESFYTISLPRNYTTLPYYHPESRDSTVFSPPPYSEY